MRETEGEASALAGEATPSLDLLFDLLSNNRRRYVLYYLNDQPDGVATVENLIDNVVALERLCDAENDGEPAASAADQNRDRGDATDSWTTVQLELKHVHLPKLEDAGILEHDRRSKTVRYWSQPSLEEWLDHAYHKEIE